MPKSQMSLKDFKKMKKRCFYVRLCDRISLKIARFGLKQGINSLSTFKSVDMDMNVDNYFYCV